MSSIVTDDSLHESNANFSTYKLARLFQFTSRMTFTDVVALMVGWSLTSLFSTVTAHISETIVALTL